MSKQDLVLKQEFGEWAVKDLSTHPQNPRKGDVGVIKESIESNGFYGAAIVQKSTGYILAGNHRYLAAKKAGIKRIPVLVLDVDDEAALRILLADNRASDKGEYNEAMLAELLRSLSDETGTLAGTLYEQSDLDALLEKMGEGYGEDKAPEAIEEDVPPEPPEEPITQPGDLIILGKHRLLCGDSTSREDVERLMDGHKADLVLTDPPYNIDYGNIKHPKFKVRPIENDNMDHGDFREFCRAFARNISEFCDDCIYVFGPPGPDGRIMFSVLDELFHASTTIVWNKDQFTLGRGKYQNKYEPCWFGWKESGRNFTEDRTLTNVWDCPRPKASDLHPTMKPIELMVRAIKDSSSVGHRVLDLFGGSGTTLMAAQETDRIAHLMELDPRYCDVIVKRWEQATGQTATRP